MFQWRRVSFVLLLAAATAGAADPTLLKLVMPNARMVSGINVEQVKNSPIVQAVLSEMQSSDASFQKFVDQTGFDPRRDLHEILIASPANPARGAEGLFLIRGSFNAAMVTAIAQKQGAALQQYKGVPILTGKQKTGAKTATARPPNFTSFAFLDDSVAALGDAASVRGAIDRRGSPMALDPKLAARAHELSNRYDIWGVSLAPPTAFSDKVPDERVSGAMKGDVLRAIEETSGGIRLGADIEIFGEAVTRSDKDATALADVIRFFAGMLQLNQKDAKITAPAQILQSMNLTTRGNVMQISMKVPQVEVEKFIRSIKANMQQQARARAAAQQSAPAVKTAPPVNPGTVTVQSSEMGTVRIKTQN